MITIEFRPRSKRAPDGFRIFIGRSEKASEIRAMKKDRELLKRLEARGEWDVLRAVRDGTLTVAHLGRLVDQYGIADYRPHVELQPKAQAPALADHGEKWLATVRRPGTRKTYGIGLRHLCAYAPSGTPLGTLGWDEVHAHHIRDLRDELLKTRERSTVATYLGAWSSFFDWAILRDESQAETEGRAPFKEANPVHKARGWLTVEPSRVRFLTREEYKDLLRVAAPPMRAQYATLTFAGLRGSEFRHLPPGHMIPAERIIVAPWGSWVPKGYPRHSRSVRDIPIHQEHLRPLLEEYAEEWAGDETFFVNPTTGEPWSETAFRKRFYDDVTAAGMVPGSRSDGEATPHGVTPHTCRHTFASWLAQEDVQLLKIAKLMGDTEATVRAYYAHLLPGDLDRSVQRLFPGSVSDFLSHPPRKGS